MFDRFTEQARRALTSARREASRLQHDYIGAQHLLIGLAEEGAGESTVVLGRLGADANRIREVVTRHSKPSPLPVKSDQLPFTPRLKRVLEGAQEESRNLGHGYVGTEHLVLALVREWGGEAGDALEQLGIRPEALRQGVFDVLVGEPPSHDVRSEPLDWFSDDAREVLRRAAAEARKLNNDYIGTEHLLLGIAESPESLAAQALLLVKVDFAEIRREVERICERGDDPMTTNTMPFTPRARRILEAARDESVRSGRETVGSEDLLVGLLLDEESPARHVLSGLRVRLADVRRVLHDLRRATPAATASPWSPWESLSLSHVIDWAAVDRAQWAARRTAQERVHGCAADIHVELLPKAKEWRYRLSLVVWPPGKRDSAIVVSVDGGRLASIEEDLPRRLDGLLRRIEDSAP